MLCITSEGGVASPPKEVIHHIATSLNEGPILLQYWSILELFCTPIGPYSQMRDVHSLYPWRMHTPVIRVPARTSQGLFGSSQKGYPLYTTSRCYASPPKEVLCITSEGGVASPPKEVIHHIATSLNEGPILVQYWSIPAHSGALMDPYSQMRDVHSLYPWRMHTPVIRVPFRTSQTPVWTPQTGVSANTLFITSR